jgi:site-specific recombinase XerD
MEIIAPARPAAPDLEVVPDPAPPGAEIETFSRPHLELVQLAESVEEYAEASLAASTLRAYRSDWASFEGWCARRGVQALPAEPATVALYLADMATVLGVSTLQRRLTTISQAHQHADLESPTKAKAVRKTMEGIRRTRADAGVVPVKKAPLRTGDIRKLVATVATSSLIGVRDRALLVVGFAGAFRRSELVTLDVDDVDFTADGLVVRIRKSKTDQEGAGASIGLPYGSDPQTCPVRTLRAWLDAAGIGIGPIFVRMDEGVPGDRMSGRAAAERVKMACRRAGLDASRYGGHSLRAGLITSAIEKGATEHRTMLHRRPQGAAWGAGLRMFDREIGISGFSTVLYLNHPMPRWAPGACRAEVVPDAKRHVFVAWLRGPFVRVEQGSEPCGAPLFGSSMASMHGSAVRSADG